MRLFSLISFCCLAAVVARSQVNRFQLYASGGALAGNEEYTLTRDASGYHIEGTTKATFPGAQLVLHEKLAVDPQFMPASYALDATVAGSAQKTRLTRSGDSYTIQAQTNGQSPSTTVEPKGPAFLLDNMIAAHSQVLLDWLATQKAESVNIQILVPQRLLMQGATVTRNSHASGKLGDAAIELEHYSIQSGGLRLELLARAGTHELMQIAVPAQSFEMVRDGFVAVLAADHAAPQPAANSNCNTREVKIASDGLELGGTLCLPLSASAEHKVPVVVMVHGSGPHDRDETIGPNKPFRDMAEGLAGKGVASLRYEKRTRAFPQWFTPQNGTLDNEVIHDAVAALSAAQAQPECGPVILLGHSLGGMFSAEIANRSAVPAGVVVMAGAVTPLDEILERQVGNNLKREGKSQTEMDEEIGKLKSQFANLRAGKAKPTDTIVGVPASYWQDLLRRDPSAEFARLQLPVLLLQGERDVQASRSDFDGLVRVLSQRSHAPLSTKLFPALNHLFMPVPEGATGKEYFETNTLSPEVIATIAGWIASFNSTSNAASR
jgi:pimeloyl-ACP methyl ester carboxylesterase